MSETRESDGERRWWKEWLKQRRVCQFDAALVGGRSHQVYLRKLGFQGPVSYGYDVVDDTFFTTEVQRWRHPQHNATHQPHPYLLASNRFISRKNLLRLIEAFALASESPTAHTKADLCLLGDGDQRQALEELCRAKGLTVLQSAPWEEQASASTAHSARVLFPGFRQIEELPRFYAHALALVHPAIAEPWGLVINEAMAAGLPILSSSNVGAAEELLDDGVNGYQFDATSTTSISLALSRFLALTHEQRQQMGKMSERLLAARCPTLSFGKGLYPLLCEG
jgi:glycosyltransferase involved in cell wall biosynthesis